MNVEKIAGSPREIEKAFGIPTKTLAQLRWQGRGPKFHKPGRVIYFFNDVEEWLKKFVVQTKDSIEM